MSSELHRPGPDRLLTSAIAGILLLGARPAIAGEAFPYPIDHRSLPNGLQVYVVPMPSPGVAALATWMSVGSRDEIEPGRTGFAHFFEHLMFHGTPTLSGDARDREILRLGADDNAWTWFDETVYHLTLPSESLPRALAIEADRFRHLQLAPEGVRREAGAVYGEFRKNRADPDEVLIAQVQATAYGRHTYAHDTIGTEADIAAMPDAFDHARSFFDRHYRPAKAAVLVVGDVAPDAVHAEVARTYGAWDAGAPEATAVPPEPAQDGPRRAEVAWTSPTAPRLAMAWRLPAFDPSDPESARLRLAAELLVGPTSALTRRLVREEGVAWAVSGGADETVDPGLFRITVHCREVADLARAEAVIREEVGALAAAVDPAALDAVRTAARYRHLSSLDDPLVVLHVLGEAIRVDRDPAALEAHWSAVAAATPGEVAAAIGRHLTPRGETVVTLVPPPEEAP